MLETRIEFLEDLLINLTHRVDHLETNPKVKDILPEKKSNKTIQKIPRGYMSCREFSSKYNFVSDVTLNNIINNNEIYFSNSLFQSNTTRYFNPLKMIHFINNNKNEYKHIKMSLNRWKKHHSDLDKLINRSKEESLIERTL
jgi:hypothetical protein